MQSTVASCLRCASLLIAMAMATPGCEKPGGSSATPDAAGGADARTADSASDPPPSDVAVAPDLPADLRGVEVPPAKDSAPIRDASAVAGTAGPRTPDLGPAKDVAATADGAPPNNGGVTALTATAANTTVGLDWPRVADATNYRVYWATSAGVSKSSSSLDSKEPALVHRGLSNGTTYYYAVAAVTATGEGDLSAEASATPGGEWVLEELGAGDFDDVATGARISRLAVKDRIHVLLVGEGYLESELGKLHDLASHNGTRANDVDRWVDEVFAIEPYPQLRSAFAVWYLPRASAAHLGGGTTAFGVTITSAGVDTVTAAAAPLFSALDGSGSDAFAFPPASPVVNHVAAFLLYDSARGRAGISGLTTTLQNPNDRNQRIGAAFGIGHAHEFTHAFASLRDEYLETTNSARSSSETANTSPTNTCSTLPWAHLLAGAGINTTEGLVGAFGTAELGFHPELKCLLNGTHDNGQFYCKADASGSYPSLTLRSDDRMCNFCREITAYRVYDRTRLLSGSVGFATWKASYRSAFYQRYGFKVPATVPQTLKCPEDSAARPIFEACVP